MNSYRFLESQFLNQHIPLDNFLKDQKADLKVLLPINQYLKVKLLFQV